MDTLLLSGIDDRQTEQLDRNPEAIFDILTMNAHKSRRANNAFTTRVFNEGLRQNDAEFEAFVREFPIDDSISECFALASETENKSPLPKFVTGAKRPQISKYSKLKKKLGWGTSEENLNMADDQMSRETKRSKKGGGIESKRHKWRTPKEKSVNFADMSEFDNIGEFPSSAEVHVAQPRDQAFANMTVASPVSMSGSSGVSHNSNISSHMTGSDDVFDPSSPGIHVTVHEGPGTPLIPPRSHGNRIPDYVNVGAVRKEEAFSAIFAHDSVEMIKNLEELPVDVAMETRDDHGNTLLHRCVELGNPDAVYIIFDRFPNLSSDMNADNMTAIELAVKLGETSCLKVMLDRNQRNKALGTPLLNRLLNISGAHGQHECLKLLLSYLPKDQPSNNCLPGDARGNTAAHVSAKNGHIKCLQTLITSGYDVTTENLIHQRPLQVAHQNDRHVCFGYLMVLDICEKLLNNMVVQACLGTMLRQQTSGIKSSIEQLKSYLDRYKALLVEARESLVENRESILESLVVIHEDLIQVTENCRNDNVDKQNEIRDKLDELAGEIERLEDTFEFSPLEDIETIFSRVAQSLDDTLTDVSSENENEVSVSDEQLKTSFCKLLQTVNDDAVAENWNTKQRVEQALTELIDQNTSLKMSSSSQTKTAIADSAVGVDNVKLATHGSESGVDYVKQIVDRNELRLSLDRLNSSNSSASQNSRHSERKSKLNRKTGSNREIQQDGNGQTQLNAQTHIVNESKDLKDNKDVTGSQNKINKDNEPKPLAITSNTKNKPSWASLGAIQKSQQKNKDSETVDRNVSGPQTVKGKEPETQTNASRTQSESISDISHTSGDTPTMRGEGLRTEKPDIRELSLEERMDLLIAGERARERMEDAELVDKVKIQFAKPDAAFNKQSQYSPLSPSGVDSIYSTTSFTSITSDSSDFSSEFQLDFEKRKKRQEKMTYKSPNTDSVMDKLVPLTMMDSSDSVTSVDMFTLTSDSTSYWWDVEDENELDVKRTGSLHSDRIKNLGNVSNEELRRQRVIQHIKALQRTRFPADEFAEKITTASGETMGGFETATKQTRDHRQIEQMHKKIVVDVHSALKAREGFKPVPVPRTSARAQVPISDSEDSYDTQSFTDNVMYKGFGAREQDVSSLDVQWEEMYMSEDDNTINGKPWYEMSSDDDVSLVPSWQSDDDTEGSRTPRMI